VAETTTEPPQTISAPPAPSTTAAPAAIGALSGGPIKATLTDIKGDVEVKAAGSSDFVPVTASTVLNEGDSIKTSFDSQVTLSFDYGQVTVYPLTQLRIDTYLSQAQLEHTGMFLHVGSVAAKVRHTAAIRGDFSVAGQYLIMAGVRDSVMVVSVANDGLTKVFTTEDVSTVRGTNDPTALTIPLGHMRQVGSDGRASPATTFAASALPALAVAPPTPSPFAPPSGPPVLAWVLAAMAATAILAGGVLLLRHRRSASAPA
jgi:hypothetical protein